VVTGASRGIGRTVALAAAARGARLGLIARSEDDLARVLEESRAEGAIAIADVADHDQLAAALDHLQERVGPVGILVNNAGVGSWGPFVELAREEIERVVQLDLVAALDATRLVLPGMLERRRGHVVNIGSVAGRLGAPFEAVYSAAKFGLVGFTEALAVEVAPLGVRVSMVNPGPVATTFAAAHPLPGTRKRPKPVTAEQVAATVIAVVEQGGLERVLPRWLRWAHLARTALPVAYQKGAPGAVREQLDDFTNRWPGPGEPGPTS
jgi:3-oxoacyl-[acyl-carrier protein] reductase